MLLINQSSSQLSYNCSSAWIDSSVASMYLELLLVFPKIRFWVDTGFRFEDEIVSKYLTATWASSKITYSLNSLIPRVFAASELDEMRRLQYKMEILPHIYHCIDNTNYFVNSHFVVRCILWCSYPNGINAPALVIDVQKTFLLPSGDFLPNTSNESLSEFRFSSSPIGS